MATTSKEVLRTYGRRKFDDDYWAYVLACESRVQVDDYPELKERAQRRLGDARWWLREAWEANRVFYVGQTEDIFRRVGEHFNKMCTDFTTLYKPYEVVKIRRARSRGAAETLEERIAKSYNEEGRTFAYYK